MLLMTKKKLDVPVMRVNTEKYQAVPMDNSEEDNALTISTARRSTIEARILCSLCGARFNREEFYHCDTCGSMVCKHCLKKHEKDQAKKENSRKAGA